ncbi:MAG: alpha-xylosidase [Phycisphaerales bacterium]|nr:alpha-xylosidase [Phycisphaerales bacterium]
MKFNYGEWQMRKGFQAHHCEQIRDVRVSEDKTRVYLYAVAYRDDKRGMGGPIQEIYVSSPMKDIIRIQSYHFRGDQKKYPAFDIQDEKHPLSFSDKDGEIVISSGSTSLVITKKPCTLTFYFNGKKITSVGNRFGSPLLSYIETPEGPFMRVQLETAIGEKVYGLGERFTPFVKNGQSVDIWNEDGGTSSDISYKNIPFYVTSNGYGVFVNDTGPVSFEVCSESVMRVQFSVPGEKMDFMVIGADGVKETLSKYTRLTGTPALPPAWTFGLWLSSCFTTSYDEKTITGFIDGMKQRDIPLSVFHIDCYWMKENEWCGFEWDKAAFPDAAAILKRLKQRGIKICVWINSYIGQKSPVFDEAVKGGYLLKRPSGDIWQWDHWQAGLGVVDFTNPAAVKWYKSKLRNLIAQGVDAFKTDFGERIPTDCVYHDGSDPLRMHNYYTYLYNKTVWEVLEEARGKGDACLFARSATVGGQKFPVHWGGDCNSTFPSMYESLRGGLSLCMSGFGFWSHDIGGFEGNASAAVYKRWLAFGLLSTHSRLHGASSYRVPWLFGEEAVEVCRKFAKLKNRLMPYIFGQAVNTSKTGIPSMRAMVMEFPGDLGAEDCDRQYMLGDALLVCPVMSEDDTARFYLPAGEWTHFLTGEKVVGGGWRQEKHDFMSLPLYVRENSILPVGSHDESPVYDYGDGLTLKIYALSGSARRDIFTADGKHVASVAAQCNNGKVTIHVDGPCAGMTVLMVGVASVRNLQGGVASVSEEGVRIAITEQHVEFDI